ncbi:MAG: thioredoxin [Bacteroidales bacterium]|nr:thioredoxin [Candidatus Sodaliphilus aphodohippi]
MAYIFTDENYKSEIESGKPMVIDFWAEWCGPCKAIAPIVEDLAKEYEGRVLIGKYDVDEGNDAAVDFGVRNIPTLLFFKDGQLVDRQVGSISRDALTAKIDALL